MNLAGFRITVISQIKDFGADPVLTQIPQQQCGEGTGESPHPKTAIPGAGEQLDTQKEGIPVTGFVQVFVKMQKKWWW